MGNRISSVYKAFGTIRELAQQIVVKRNRHINFVSFIPIALLRSLQKHEVCLQ